MGETLHIKRAMYFDGQELNREHIDPTLRDFDLSDVDREVKRLKESAKKVKPEVAPPYVPPPSPSTD